MEEKRKKDARMNLVLAVRVTKAIFNVFSTMCNFATK